MIEVGVVLKLNVSRDEAGRAITRGLAPPGAVAVRLVAVSTVTLLSPGLAAPAFTGLMNSVPPTWAALLTARRSPVAVDTSTSTNSVPVPDWV